MDRMRDKRALVTGAASGIGRATAERLASEGAQVYCADLQEEACSETVETILKAGGHAIGSALDVSDPESCKSAVSRAAHELGGLDILCNIAGILRSGHTAELVPADWQAVISVNLSGTFYMCSSALPALADGGGVIVNMASVAGLQGVPYGAAYSASKAGVIGLTRSIAAEYAQRAVRANAICPGGVMTPMTAGGFKVDGEQEIDARLLTKLAPMMPRIGTPEEIAGLVAYLSSDEASYITGTTVTIDGGQIA